MGYKQKKGNNNLNKFQRLNLNKKIKNYNNRI